MESRRSARIPARFWVGVEGVDDVLKQRHGDISATGMYFEEQQHLGDIGTVQWLHMASIDREHRLEVMAHIVRVITFADLRRGSVTGVALEFMPESDDSAQAVSEFVRHVLGLRLQEDLAMQVDHKLEASVDLEGGPDGGLKATVRQLSVHGLLLDTNWSMKVGDTVAIDIHAPSSARPIRIRGQAINVIEANEMEGAARFRIELHVKDDEPGIPTSTRTSFGPQSARASIRPGAMESLFADLIAPPSGNSAPMRKEHLAGQLARIRMPTLLSLFEMERMTGVLSLLRGDNCTRVFVREGQIVDVEDEGAKTEPRERLMTILGWNEGSFDFCLSSVDRPDRIDTSTTALILDLARADDESRALAT